MHPGLPSLERRKADLELQIKDIKSQIRKQKSARRSANKLVIKYRISGSTVEKFMTSSSTEVDDIDWIQVIALIREDLANGP